MSDAANLPPIVLASTSPRRAKLLDDAGCSYTQRKPSFDDSHVNLAEASPIRAAEALAYLKAASVADELDRGIVIGSDTVLIVDGRMIGKPRDAVDARVILSSLFDQRHEVCSAVALIDAANDRNMIFHDITTVVISHPGRDAFDAYLNSNQWQGKAGGYNLAELENDWRFEVDGDPTTVVGLPMQRLAAALASFTHSSEPAE